jgi:hypothetical protein
MTLRLLSRITLSLIPIVFLSSGNLEEPICEGCETGAPLLSASEVTSVGQVVTISLDSTAGDCFSAFVPPATWGCHPEGCTFQITRSWIGMAPGDEVQDCWGWENPRTGVNLTRNCDVIVPAPVVGNTGIGSSIVNETARCQSSGYFWEVNVGNLSAEVSTVCTMCGPVPE